MEILITDQREEQIKRLLDLHPDAALGADELRKFISRRPFSEREIMRRTLGDFLIEILE